MNIYKTFIYSLTFMLLSGLYQQTHSAQDEENNAPHQNAVHHNGSTLRFFPKKGEINPKAQESFAVRSAGYGFLNDSDIIKLSMAGPSSYNGVRNDFTKQNRTNITLSPKHKSDAVFRSINQIFSQISNLFLNDCYYIADNNLNELSNSLMHLDISGCSNITDNGAKVIAERCIKLHSLYMAECNKLTDVSLACFADTYKHLEKLNISGNRKFTEDSIVPIINKNPSLKYINVSKCSNVSDRTMVAIADTCHDLVCLETEYCFKIKAALPYLLEKCTNINLFNVSNCYNISNMNDVASLLARNAPKLQMLSLANCEGVTDAHVALIIQNCLVLTSLDLTACDMLTDESAFEIGMNSKELQSLNLSGCTKMTDVILKLLCIKGRQLSKMRYVNLNGCTLITAEVIAHFTKKFNMKTLEDNVFARKLLGD